MKPTRKLPSHLLYLGIVMFGLLLLAVVMRVAEDWAGRVESGRARAFYELVHGYIPNRPTDTPGAIAWLHWELDNYLAQQEQWPNGLSSDLAAWQDFRSIPSLFAPLADVLTVVPDPELPPHAFQPVLLPGAEEELEKLQFRTQFYVFDQDLCFVVTRRLVLGEGPYRPENPSDVFLGNSISHLLNLASHLGPKAEQVVRLYTLCEDGMLTTFPLSPSEDNVSREGKALRGMPNLPTFVSNEFFFVFDYSKESIGKPFFSGLYLDLGGQGLIATLTAPLVFEDSELKGIVGMDISFPLDWEDFAASISEPLRVEVVNMDGTPRPEGWRPWRALLESGALQDKDVRDAVTWLARADYEARHFHNPTPIYHGVADDLGAVVAFEAGDGTWMVTLFPEYHSNFPLGSIVLLSALFLILLAGFEWNRRRAEAAQNEAVREFEEKQNLLETMQVPLIVVDPNTESVVFSNKAAQGLGIHKAGRFADVVADDDAVRAHYHRMQVAAPHDRRAYGLPLKVGNETRYAVIRSVAVRAPIHMIGADERHRLGILFLIEPEEDLKLLTGALVERTQQDERRKLSGLLSHGVDTLARVLNYRLEQGKDDAFNAWLSSYIQRRIRVVAWLMDQWQHEGALRGTVVIGPSNTLATIERLDKVFQLARNDRALRAQLHWNNGILAKTPTEHTDHVFQTQIQWNDAFSFALPVRGGLGLFLGEVLINAIRHGAPGCTPKIHITLDRLRQELTFVVSNAIQAGAPADERMGKKYGGRSIVTRLAHLFGWHNLRFEQMDGEFRVSWNVTVARKESDREED